MSCYLTHVYHFTVLFKYYFTVYYYGFAFSFTVPRLYCSLLHLALQVLYKYMSYICMSYISTHIYHFTVLFKQYFTVYCYVFAFSFSIFPLFAVKSFTVNNLVIFTLLMQFYVDLRITVNPLIPHIY